MGRVDFILCISAGEVVYGPSVRHVFCVRESRTGMVRPFGRRERPLSATVSLVLGLLWCPHLAAHEPVGRPLQFNRDIRPILSEKCLRCHGPDKNARQADLRLDDEHSAYSDRDGSRAITPGHPEKSELIRRITSNDPEERMPPAESRLKLSAREITLLRRWIAQGGGYQKHWAFIPPRRPPVPPVRQTARLRNPIDAFIASRLEREGWRPSPSADRVTLIRRVTLDLTGLPPTPRAVDAFLSDTSPVAYERMVDRLLASPRYGERMALLWLDAARFADSGGYQGDILRTMWPWRDWVIGAYNDNMPFDQFTIEQLAGDLLPHPTRAQRIATGFNRNHRINDEDGIIPEEFRVEYVADRVETTVTVWMGLTFRCARCHDHKYDPFSQQDYYRLYAYFNSVAESGRGHGNAPPVLRLLSSKAERRLAAIERSLMKLRSAVSTTTEPTRKSSGNSPAGHSSSVRAKQIRSLEAEKKSLSARATVTMVMQDLPQPRKTHVLIRGGYNKPGKPVFPGVPPALGTPLPSGAPANRLALARWLVDPRHPLTARVAVNRYWQMLFGRGLVATPEDFGSQGRWPSHPDLLDWLAREFIRSGWDVKAMLRLMVTSATYRQSARGTVASVQRDPQNRLLSRGPRYRLPAELIRDQALAASGLLVERLGGPSVRPYQPPDLWKELASASAKYNQSHGPNLYRRSLYTFVRRTIPNPAMTAFDATNRELCTVRRARTDTPLQALVSMNDPTYVEAARVLAERVMLVGRGGETSRVREVFRRLTGRLPGPAEQQLLLRTLRFYRMRYRNNPPAATRLVRVGESVANKMLDVSELAAYTAIAGLVMNLDEVVTKE